MKVVHRKRALSRVWSNHPAARGRVVAETDIAITKGPLRAKLLVFRNSKALRAFWKDGLKLSGHGESLGFRCLGAVNALAHEFVTVREGRPDLHRLEVDPRYFCVIGLIQNISERASAVEYLTHEATHAAFAYAKRVGERNMWPGSRTMDEESVAYPVGRIARAINRFMQDRNLW